VAAIGEVFPHMDPTALFVVAVGMARNDIQHASWAAAKANKEDDPAFFYYVRLAIGHTHEAVDAVNHWRQESADVQNLIGRLDKPARQALAKATSMAKDIGGGAVQQTRHHTFHYPFPGATGKPVDALADVLERLSGDEATLSYDVDEPRRYRFDFSDKAALMLAMRRFDPDEDVLREQIGRVLEGAGGFVRFSNALLHLYLGKA
jgi:hypothetical protein